MDSVILFKLGDKNILEDTKKISLEGKEDKKVRKIILENFIRLFPHLELYNKGSQTELPIFKEENKNKKSKRDDWVRKPDSLAFCENEKQLYILEYKSKIDENILDQTKKYRSFLQTENVLLNLILKWNKQANKHREIEDFKDNKAKIICISPEFDDYTI